MAQTTLAKIFAGLVLILAVPQMALAVEWQYCLAPSNTAHKVYISDAFPVRGASHNADDMFGRVLDAAGLRHDVVQCPRADDQRSIVAMQRYATAFNRDIGNVVVRVPFDRIR